MASSNGNFVWYDLMSTDAKAAEAFYRGVVGWRMQDAGMPDRSYTILSAGETAVGGLMALPPEACDAGAKPVWSGYVAVDDVDAFASRVKQAGGAIHHPPDDIPGVGRFAFVADPQGATFVLFKGMSDARPRPVRRATPAGASCRPPTGRAPSRSTPPCSGGRRPMPSIWAQWESISCSRSTACRRAA